MDYAGYKSVHRFNRQAEAVKANPFTPSNTTCSDKLILETRFLWSKPPGSSAELRIRSAIQHLNAAECNPVGLLQTWDEPQSPFACVKQLEA
jgi:hypothetical protein